MEQILNYDLSPILFALFVVVLIVLWVCLPFAVFGINEQLISETRKTNASLQSLFTQLEAQKMDHGQGTEYPGSDQSMPFDIRADERPGRQLTKDRRRR